MSLRDSRTHSSEQGVVLVMAIMLLAVLGLIITATTRLMAGSWRQQKIFAQQARLERALDCGLSMSLARLADHQPPGAFTVKGEFGGMIFIVQCRPLTPAACVVRISVTTPRGRSRTAVARLKLMQANAAHARRWLISRYELGGIRNIPLMRAR